MELCNSVKFKDLGQQVTLRIQEESPPEDAIPSLVRCQVNQPLVVAMLASDPELLCSRMFEGAHVISFISTDDQFGCLVISLEGEVQATKSTAGRTIDSIRDRLGLQSQVVVVGNISTILLHGLHPTRNSTCHVERCLAGKASVST